VVFISVKNDRRQSRGGFSERERAARDAIIVAARYIIRTFANLLARGHPGFRRRQDEGDPALGGRGEAVEAEAAAGAAEGERKGDREYVPCVSDFIISVLRNVRHPTKARPRAEEGFNAGERVEGDWQGGQRAHSTRIPRIPARDKRERESSPSPPPPSSHPQPLA